MPLYCPLFIGSESKDFIFCQHDNCAFWDVAERECCIKVMCNSLKSWDRVYLNFPGNKSRSDAGIVTRSPQYDMPVK